MGPIGRVGRSPYVPIRQCNGGRIRTLIEQCGGNMAELARNRGGRSQHRDPNSLDRHAPPWHIRHVGRDCPGPQQGMPHMNANVDLTTLSQAELIELISNMAKANRAKLTMKVSEKGALSIYGFGQWPVTLYASQWRRLIESIDDVVTFLDTHRAVLAEKPVK